VNLARAVEAASGRGAAAQLCVIRDGTVVLDRSFGCRPESLFWIFSASKPYVAMLIHQLARTGALRLDDPVATYWPRFASGGKGAITIRQVLRHRSGLTSSVGDALAMADWSRSVRRVERARPRRPAGAGPAYSPIAYGFVLGELAGRVTCRPVQDLLRDEILTPLQAADTYLGLPDEQWPRHVPIRARTPGGSLVEAVVNRRRTRRAVIPAAGISTTARDLARFYLMLLDGGRAGGTRILHPDTIAQAVTPSSDGGIDPVARAPIRWAQGFQLGGAPRVPNRITPLGMHSSASTFGHNGSNCCIGWADPTRRLAFAYLTNRVESPSVAVRHHATVADHVIDACTDG
jgi:CubicO group peptidase (beta-lactamase class C family)